MNETATERTALVIGEKAVNALANKRVAVFGVGGVGGAAVEALARIGVGTIDLFDSDCVNLSNLNRQIIATYENVGQLKVEAAKNRILSINPDATVNCFPIFYLPENADRYDLSVYDYVLDAIDTVSAKIELVKRCNELKVPIICSMGTGNKLDPTAFTVSDISKTEVCPLARAMRRSLKKLGINHLKVVYSKEVPVSAHCDGDGGKRVPGSVSFVPPVAGYVMAGEAIKDMIKDE